MKLTPTKDNSASNRAYGMYAFLFSILPHRNSGKRSLPVALLAIFGLIGQIIFPAASLRAQYAATGDESDAATASPAGVQFETDYKPNELLVAFRPGTSSGRVESARAGVGAERIKRLREIGVEHWRLPEGFGVERAMRALAANPNVSYAEPNYIVHASDYPALPNDTNRGELWGMHNLGQTGGTMNRDINAPEAWAVTTGSSDVVIGVIDSGIDYNHPDLQQNIWVNEAEIPDNGVDDDGNGYIDDVRGWDFANNDNDPMDDNGHGSHVAGTIGAVGSNGVGVVGVNWNVRLMPLKFLGAGGSGDTANAAAAVLYAASFKRGGANVVRLTNNSWGGGRKSSTMQNAIANSGSLFVAAAGNGGSSQVEYPAGYNNSNVLSVAATDHNDALATFSNFSSSWVDLAAPGVNIASTYKGGYAILSGTSMASPHVAGVAGLVIAAFPGISTADLKSRIMDNVDPVPALAGKTVTGGRLNAAKAVGSTYNASDDCAGPPCSPADVNDFLVGFAEANALTLTWTATGDDGTSGSAYLVDIRISTSPIDASNFAAAPLAYGKPTPKASGTGESYTVKGLRPETHYYAAMRIADEVGNYSGLAFTEGTTAQGIWAVNTVEDGPNNVGFYSSLAYDSANNPSIGYSDDTASSAKFAHWNGTAWETEVVDLNQGTGMSLAYDPAGNPTMTYGWGKLRFAQYVPSTSSWQISILESKNANNDVTSLQYDPSGNASVAYSISTARGGTLKFARRGATGWVLQTVATAGARYKSLAYDSQGRPSIAFSDDVDGDNTLDTLKFARWNGTSWVVQTVETGVAGYGVHASLAYDDAGNPAIVHRAAGAVRFVRWNGTSWDPAEIAGNGGNCWLSFSSGKFYVTYSDQTGVWLGTRENGVWNTEGVDTGIQARWIVTHAMSSCGTPSLAYSTYPNYDLKFAAKCE